MKTDHCHLQVLLSMETRLLPIAVFFLQLGWVDFFLHTTHKYIYILGIRLSDPTVNYHSQNQGQQLDLFF